MEAYPLFHFDRDAVSLHRILQRQEIKEVDCIVSGLPFAMFSHKLRNKILQAVYKSLKPGGIFVAFQYSLQMKTMFEQLFDKVIISLVPLNLPPAFVYFCQKGVMTTKLSKVPFDVSHPRCTIGRTSSTAFSAA